ncbi:MAG: hypothetical protein LC750_03745 [Actinobacteria bacterium]|nr:hypothetical protein [Actinomycetota bacterium]
MSTARPAHATFAGSNGRIAFNRFNPAIDEFSIYAANPDGSGEVVLTAIPSGSPDWSPGGTRIAFDYLVFCNDTDCEIDIGTMNPDGTGFTQLTSGSGFRVTPTWSPDGSKIAFDNNGAIAIMDAAYGANVSASRRTRTSRTEPRRGPPTDNGSPSSGSATRRIARRRLCFASTPTELGNSVSRHGA